MQNGWRGGPGRTDRREAVQEGKDWSREWGTCEQGEQEASVQSSRQKKKRGQRGERTGRGSARTVSPLEQKTRRQARNQNTAQGMWTETTVQKKRGVQSPHPGRWEKSPEDDKKWKLKNECAAKARCARTLFRENTLGSKRAMGVLGGRVCQSECVGRLTRESRVELDKDWEEKGGRQWESGKEGREWAFEREPVPGRQDARYVVRSECVRRGGKGMGVSRERERWERWVQKEWGGVQG